MKVLVDHSEPFFLMHGGFQVQIEKMCQGVRDCGATIEFVRWWDSEQKGDIIHFYGRPLPNYIEAAHAKGLKVVITPLHTSTGSRKLWKLAGQWLMTRVAERMIPSQALFRLAWSTYRNADAVILSTNWEATLVHRLFRTPAGKIHIVPNGVEDFFHVDPSVKRGKWLVPTAVVIPRKRVVETAKAAIEAKTPYWVIGKPFSETDPYYIEWLALCRAHPEWIRYEGATDNREFLATAYKEARGFVLLSTAETLSLSATEASACGCPLLLSDLPWARSTFADAAQYAPIADVAQTARSLRAFYDAAPGLKPPPKQKTWKQIGESLCAIYESVLCSKLA